MIQKPRDYDTAQSYDSDFSRLPAGGYVVDIKRMEEATASTGKQMVIVSFDIAEGEYKDYFARQYKNDKSREITSGRTAKWRGVYYTFPLTSEGLTNPSFKGIMTCIENSNYGFHVQWPLNFDLFKGKKLGLLFRDEEYVANDGTVKVSVKPCSARSVDCIQSGEFNTPSRKKLENVPANASAPSACGALGQSVYSTQEFVPTTVEDDELPF